MTHGYVILEYRPISEQWIGTLDMIAYKEYKNAEEKLQYMQRNHPDKQFKIAIVID